MRIKMMGRGEENGENENRERGERERVKGENKDG